MHKLSSTLAFITNKIFIVLLIVITLALAQTVAIAQIVTNKDKVKSVLAESNIYSNLPGNAIYIIKIDDSDQHLETINTKTVYQVLEQNGFIKAKDFNTVIVKVVSPDFLQNQTEKLIDNTYAFLEGDKDEILFSFSLKDRANVAKNEISQLINDKLASLPACSNAQLLAMVNQEVNILEAVCLPPGVSLQSKIDEFTNELTAKDGIFAQEFTQKDVDISDADANLARYVYSSLKSTIWMFWLLFVSFSAVIILTSKTLHRGLKTVGAIHVLLGSFLLAGYLFIVKSYNFVDNIVLSSNELSVEESEALTTITAPLFNGFVNQVVTQITIISLVIIIIGLALFILGIFATKHQIEHLYLPKNSHDLEPINSQNNISGTTAKQDSKNDQLTATKSEVNDK